MFRRLRGRRARAVDQAPGEAAEAAGAPDEPGGAPFIPSVPEGEPVDYGEVVTSDAPPDYPVLRDFERDYLDTNENGTGVPNLYIVTPTQRGTMELARQRFVPNGLIFNQRANTIRFAPHLQHGQTTTVAHTSDGIGAALEDELLKFRGSKDSQRVVWIYQIDPDFVKEHDPVRLRDFLADASPEPDDMGVEQSEVRPLREDTLQFINQMPIPELTAEDSTRLLRDYTYRLNPADPARRPRIQTGLLGEGNHEKQARFNIGLSHMFRDFHLNTPSGIPTNKLIPYDFKILEQGELSKGKDSVDMRSALWKLQNRTPQQRYNALYRGHDARIARATLPLYQQEMGNEQRRYEIALERNLPDYVAPEKPPTYADSTRDEEIVDLDDLAASAAAPDDDQSDDSGEFGF